MVNWVNFLCKRQAVVSHHSLHRPPVVVLEFEGLDKDEELLNVGHDVGHLPPSPPEARGSATHLTWCQPLEKYSNVAPFNGRGRMP
jgi:hypothetical protein